MSKEIAVKEETAIDLFGDNVSGYTGFENVDTSSDVKIPYLKIAQADMDQVNEGTASYIEGLKPGYFFNNVSGKNYGKEVRLIVLGYFHHFTRWGCGLGEFKEVYSKEEFEAIKDKLIQDGGKFLDPATGSDPKEQDRITEHKKLLVINADHLEDGFMMFDFTSSALGVFKKWMSMAFTEKRIYDSIWTFTTLQRENEKFKKRWWAVGDKKSVLAKKVGSTREIIDSQEKLSMLKDALETVMEITKDPTAINMKEDSEGIEREVSESTEY